MIAFRAIISVIRIPRGITSNASSPMTAPMTPDGVLSAFNSTNNWERGPFSRGILWVQGYPIRRSTW